MQNVYKAKICWQSLFSLKKLSMRCMCVIIKLKCFRIYLNDFKVASYVVVNFSYPIGFLLILHFVWHVSVAQLPSPVIEQIVFNQISVTTKNSNKKTSLNPQTKLNTVDFTVNYFRVWTLYLQLLSHFFSLGLLQNFILNTQHIIRSIWNFVNVKNSNNGKQAVVLTGTSFSPRFLARQKFVYLLFVFYFWVCVFSSARWYLLPVNKLPMTFFFLFNYLQKYFVEVLSAFSATVVAK